MDLSPLQYIAARRAAVNHELAQLDAWEATINSAVPTTLSQPTSVEKPHRRAAKRASRESASPKLSYKDQIMRVFSDYPNREWTMDEVGDYLEQMNPGVAIKRNIVSAQFTRFLGAGQIVRTGDDAYRLHRGSEDEEVESGYVNLEAAC